MAGSAPLKSPDSCGFLWLWLCARPQSCVFPRIPTAIVVSSPSKLQDSLGIPVGSYGCFGSVRRCHVRSTQVYSKMNSVRSCYTLFGEWTRDGPCSTDAAPVRGRHCTIQQPVALLLQELLAKVIPAPLLALGCRLSGIGAPGLHI